MKTAIKAIIFLIMGFTVIFYGGALLLPGEARVERTVEVAAPPERVFTIAAELRRVPDWSPWTDIDPATTFTFDGPEQGEGQVMRWASNNPLVGSGTQTLTDAVAPQRLVFANDYGAFGTSVTSMGFTPEGAGTRVTWLFQSRLPGVLDRWAGLGIDRSVGAEFEKGLRNLKALAETP